MRRGKEIAQGAHASMAFITKKIKNGIDLSEVEKLWINGNFAKVCLQVNSEEELLQIEAAANCIGLEVNLITDSGLTEFNGVPTKTCLAIGPFYESIIDSITASLKLY